jgi:hypothetical protein
MIICPLPQASIRLRLLVLFEPPWSVTSCRWRLLDMLLMRNRRAVSSFLRCRRKESKWTVLLIALIVWPRRIRSLRNLPSLSLYCASRIFAHCSRLLHPLSTIMCDQRMVETPPLLDIIARLLHPTHVRLVHLSQTLAPSLFRIFVLALIHSVFVDDGATLLRIASSWPCIFFSQTQSRVIFHEKLRQGITWPPHGVNGFYLGPAMEC